MRRHCSRKWVFGVRAQAMGGWEWQKRRREKEHSEEEGGNNMF